MHCGQPSPYPLGTRTPQPPAAALLARSRGDLASLDPFRGCGRSARGGGFAQQLQQQHGERSTSMRAATLSCARMREASGSRCSANVSARAMRVRSRGCRSGGVRNMAAAAAASFRRLSAGKIACVQVQRKNRRCVQRPRGRGWLRHGRFFVSGEGTRVARCQDETART